MNGSGQKVTVGGLGSTTLIMTRQMSNWFEDGLLARNVTSVAPAVSVASNLFAHIGCESTYLFQSTFVSGFGMRTKIVS